MFPWPFVYCLILSITGGPRCGHNNNLTYLMRLKKLLSAASASVVMMLTLFTAVPAVAAVYYFDNKVMNWSSPHCYAWKNDSPVSAAWPGSTMTKVGESTIWKYETNQALDGIIFNNGSNENQTDNLTPVDGHVYIKTSGDNKTGQDSGKTYEQYISGENPDPQPGEYVYYFDNSSANWGSVNAYLWNSGGELTGKWPGKEVKETVTNPKGCTLYKFTYTGSYAPQNIIFNNGGNGSKTEDLIAVSGNVYYSGMNKNDTGRPFATYQGSNGGGGGVSTLGAVQSYKLTDNILTVTSENGTLTLTAYSRDIVKVFPLPTDASPATERKSIAVVKEPETDLAITTTEADDKLTMSIEDGVTVEINKSNSTLTFSKDNNILLREKDGLKNKIGNISASFQGMNDSGFYGGGYTGGNSNRKDKTITMDNHQQWGYSIDDDNHNICIPVIISTNGYGIYFDSQYRGAQIKSSSSGITYSSSARNPIAYYFLGSGTMESAVTSYVDLTGHQELPPFWALGYITSKYSFASRSEAEEVVNNTKNANLPLDGIVFDIHWQGGQGSGGAGGMGYLNWGSAYSNPREMMKNFSDKHVKAICITEPFFNSENTGDNYNTLKNNGWLADENTSNMGWVGNKVGLIDATNPDALSWMWDFYKARTEEGVEGWWLDLGEPEQHDGDSRHKGGTVDEVHNEFGNLWTESVYNGMKRDFPDKRRFLMPRAGTAGMQRFSTFPWTGDIERSWGGLQGQIPSLINGSMSGLGYLGSDVGGFADKYGTNAELYERWVEFAVFSPMMRTHSGTSPMPYLSCYSGQLDNIRRMLNLRYSYLPYIYTNAYTYTTTGRPLCLPSAFFDENPSSELISSKTQFLAGRDILVAPVVNQGSQNASVTFPEGKWFDLNQAEKQTAAGGSPEAWNVYSGSATYNAPLGVLPHFARAGSFVTRYAADSYTSTAEIDRTQLRVDYFYDRETAMAGATTGRLYEDDTTTPDPISDGNYLLTTFTAAYKTEWDAPVISIDSEGKLTDGMPQSHSILLAINNFTLSDSAEPHFVTYIDGPAAERRSLPQRNSSNTLDRVPSAEALDRAESGYYNDSARNRLLVKLPAHSPLARTVLDLGGDGISTSVVEIDAARMSLRYESGIISYQIPESAETGRLDIYSVTGVSVMTAENLAADGTVSQIEADLMPGVYVGRLEAIAADGARASKSIKFIVK